MNTKNILLSQIKSMENHYIHLMEMYHAVLSEKSKEIDQNKIYTINELKDFFKNHPELYYTWWLDWYSEAIWVLKNLVKKFS